MFRGLGDPHCQAWRLDRVRVVAVCPSVTDTNMVRAALQMLSPADQERAGNEGPTKVPEDFTITEKAPTPTSSFINVKAVVAAFNLEKAPTMAFSVIVHLH